MATNTTSSKNAQTKNKNATTSLSTSFRGCSGTLAIEEFIEVCEHYDLIPAATRKDTITALDQLREVLQRGDFNVHDMLTKQRSILANLAGIQESAVTQFLSPSVAEPLHRYRNLLVVAAAFAVGAQSSSTSPEDSRPETVYANSIRLQQRRDRIHRPLTDDEILLGRVAALLASLRNPLDRTALLWALSETGMVPLEISRVSVEDFDDPLTPSTVLASGNAQIEGRFLTPTIPASVILSRHNRAWLADGKPRDKEFAYAPNLKRTGGRQRTVLEENTSRTVGIQRTIDKLFTDLGFTKRPQKNTTKSGSTKAKTAASHGLTASSIAHWRIATAIQTDGHRIALAISGRSSTESMIRTIGAYEVPTETAPKISTNNFELPAA